MGRLDRDRRQSGGDRGDRGDKEHCRYPGQYYPDYRSDCFLDHRTEEKKKNSRRYWTVFRSITRYEVYYYLSTDKWQTAEDLDLSAITITAVTSYRSELNTDFLKDLTMTPENGAADVQECVAIEKVRLSVPTAFSSISYELTTQNKLYVKVGGINLAEAIYEEVYEENNVRYRLCYQMDTPWIQLMFFTV